VKNPLNKILDPALIGMAITEQLQVVCKSVSKTSPTDKLGNILVKDDHPFVLSSDAMKEDMAKEKNTSGRLKYNHLSTFEFLFEVHRLLEIFSDSSNLPKLFDKRSVKAYMWNEDIQKSEEPEKENAYKFEISMTNAFKFIEKNKFGLLEVEREEEFAPVKSPEDQQHAIELISDLHKKYFALAEGDFDGEGDFEIDVLMSY
jgi:UDP-N-acetylglucosamine/UDP-N-acetylgalactosamine diphosphorylase